MRPHILIADDDSYILQGAVLALKHEFEVSTASSVAAAKMVLSKNEIELAVVDLNFEGQEEDGIILIDHLNKKFPAIPVVVLSADQQTRRVVSAMRRDPTDFITKEGDYRESLKIAIRKGLEQRRQRIVSKADVSFLTNSAKMKLLLAKADKIIENNNDCSILIHGETGTGKEVLTKYIAARLKKQLVAANMASIPKETAESELFGHMAGSFTGATRNKLGLIEQASGGIFFLDELGECSLSLQAKLLRVIQEKEIMPIGGLKPRKIDVQFIGATNRNLQEMVQEKEFRLDLLQRLNTFVLEIPSLRERPEDIILYTTQFVEELGTKKPFHIDPSAFDVLLKHDWPGNVRELKNVIERIITLATSRVIDAESVRATVDDEAAKFSQSRKLKLNRKEILHAGEVIRALEQENGNRAKAAQLLGVHRATFFRWLKQLGIDDIMADPSLYERIRSRKLE